MNGHRYMYTYGYIVFYSISVHLMILIEKEIGKDGSGRIKLLPQGKDDLWHLYNLINEGNVIKTRTVRKVTSESSSEDSKSTERKVLMLIIRVERVEYDPLGGFLRVVGKNIGENDFVRIGQHHSTDVQLNTSISISKSRWDALDLNIVSESCDPNASADVAVVMLDESFAELFLISSHMYSLQVRLESGAKSKQSFGNEKKLQKFYERISSSVEQYFSSEKVKVILLASNTDACKILFDKLKSMPLKAIDKSKILQCKIKSTTRSSLQDVFSDAAVLKRISNTKFAGEIKQVHDFLKKLEDDPSMVTYGYVSTKSACAHGAIQTLLVSDTIANSVFNRKKISALIDDVESFGGTYHKISVIHSEGQNLIKYTGLAAILRFPSHYFETESQEKHSSENVKGDSLTQSPSDLYGGKLLVKGR